MSSAMSALPPKADMFGFEIDVCLVPLTDISAWQLLVADTTNPVTDLRVEGLLLEGLVRAGSWPQVGGL